ncbi:uncharacterized protein LOC134822771 [Bolinopsis microptera]|uniref:uncharacterized protein LOC134822771 n=1 Tax=Bolinopsis microptera TaxID=2820187 RepID=UPI003079A8F5
MKLNDEQSIFPLLQLTSLSPSSQMPPKEPVPVLPKIECRSSMVSRSASGSSLSSASFYNGGKYSGSCPALPTNSRNSGSTTSSRNGKLYTPVEFEINPISLPYMGTDYRKVGRVRRVTTESSAVKQNEVQHKGLEKKAQSLSRRRDQIQKDYTRTLTLWHMEQERNKNHKDPALQRRTVRILKFIDKMAKTSEKFHFKDGFFLDLMDPEYFPEPSPPPLNINRPDSKRPIFKQPFVENEGRSKSTGQFYRRDSTAEALKEKFRQCKKAGDVQGCGYVYVKIHTDPYYRYLPPLSNASKNYDVRLAKLPHKTLRNEEQWRKFLDSLRAKTPPPPPPEPKAPTVQELRKARTEELKKKLPIISLLPKWLREVRDKNDIRSERYIRPNAGDDQQPILELVAAVNSEAVENSKPVSRPTSRSNNKKTVEELPMLELVEAVNSVPSTLSVSRPSSRKRAERKNPATIIESHTKADMNGVIKTIKPTTHRIDNHQTTVMEGTPETSIKHRIRATK